MNQNEPLQNKIRIAVFGSFYRGFYVLNELLYGSLRDEIEIVGVATDDVHQNFISAHKRVWQYVSHPEEPSMMEKYVIKSGLPFYKGEVKNQAFYHIIEHEWKPDLCIMATFGQKLNARLIDLPSLGFFNLHPCIDDGWPSGYAGPNPFQALLFDRCSYVKIAMHRVSEKIDHGELIAYSDAIYFPEHVNVVDLHKITSPLAAQLAVREIRRIISPTQRRSLEFPSS